MKKEYRRGEIYDTDFGEGIGSEQTGIRPALIVQNNVGNAYSATIIVAAITSGKHIKAVVPTHCNVGTDTGLKVPSIILLEQLRTVSKERIGTYIGKLGPRDMTRIVYPLAISIGMVSSERETLMMFLCKKCAADIRATNYRVRPSGNRKLKDVCMRCHNHLGSEYEIKPPRI